MTPLLFVIASVAGLSVAGGNLGAAPIQAGGGPVSMGSQATPNPRPPAAGLFHDVVPMQQQGTPAPASINSEIIVLHGTNDNSGIDPKIGKLPALSKPPLSSYNSYKLLDRTNVSLAKAKAGTYKLPNGRELRVVYKDVNAPSKPGDPPRFVYSASIHEPDGKLVTSTEYVAKAGDWFWLGGQDYKGGGLVLGFKIGP